MSVNGVLSTSDTRSAVVTEPAFTMSIGFFCRPPRSARKVRNNPTQSRLAVANRSFRVFAVVGACGILIRLYRNTSRKTEAANSTSSHQYPRRNAGNKLPMSLCPPSWLKRSAVERLRINGKYATSMKLNARHRQLVMAKIRSNSLWYAPEKNDRRGSKESRMKSRLEAAMLKLSNQRP